MEMAMVVWLSGTDKGQAEEVFEKKSKKEDTPWRPSLQAPCGRDSERLALAG
jgi:hypothetical protein